MRNTMSVDDKFDLNWVYGLLLPADYPVSLEINILIGV